jgi:hypothetical protein
MTTKTINTNIYKFTDAKDISTELFDRCRDNYSDINTDYNWWDFDCIVDFKEYDRYIAYNSSDLNFSLYNKSINLNLFIANDMIDAIICNCLSAKDIGTITKCIEKNYIEFDLNNNEYYINISDKNNILNDLCSDIMSYFEKLMTQWNSEALEILNNQYDYLISDEAIIDTFIDNEYYFGSDGKIVQ